MTLLAITQQHRKEKIPQKKS